MLLSPLEQMIVSLVKVPKEDPKEAVIAETAPLLQTSPPAKLTSISPTLHPRLTTRLSIVSTSSKRGIQAPLIDLIHLQLSPPILSPNPPSQQTTTRPIHFNTLQKVPLKAKLSSPPSFDIRTVDASSPSPASPPQALAFPSATSVHKTLSPTGPDSRHFDKGAASEYENSRPSDPVEVQSEEVEHPQSFEDPDGRYSNGFQERRREDSITATMLATIENTRIAPLNISSSSYSQALLETPDPPLGPMFESLEADIKSLLKTNYNGDQEAQDASSGGDRSASGSKERGGISESSRGGENRGSNISPRGGAPPPDGGDDNGNSKNNRPSGGGDGRGAEKQDKKNKKEGKEEDGEDLAGIEEAPEDPRFKKMVPPRQRHFPAAIIEYQEKCLSQPDGEDNPCVALGKKAMEAYKAMVDELTAEYFKINGAYEAAIKCISRNDEDGDADKYEIAMLKYEIKTLKSKLADGMSREDCDKEKQLLQEKIEELETKSRANLENAEKRGRDEEKTQQDAERRSKKQKEDHDKEITDLERKNEKQRDEYNNYRAVFVDDLKEAEDRVTAAEKERQKIEIQLLEAKKRLSELEQDLRRPGFKPPEQIDAAVRTVDGLLKTEIIHLPEKPNRDDAGAFAKAGTLDAEVVAVLEMQLRTLQTEVAGLTQERNDLMVKANDTTKPSDPAKLKSCEKKVNALKRERHGLKEETANLWKQLKKAEGELTLANDKLGRIVQAKENKTRVEDDRIINMRNELHRLQKLVPAHEKVNENIPDDEVKSEELIDDADPTFPVLFALTRVEIALLEMVNARTRIGMHADDTSEATSAARSALALAESLPEKLARDWIARANFWMAVTRYYADEDQSNDLYLEEAYRRIEDIEDEHIRESLGQWMAGDRLGIPVNRGPVGYRERFRVNVTWKSNRKGGASNAANAKTKLKGYNGSRTGGNRKGKPSRKD